jgi:hypothetical protein
MSMSMRRFTGKPRSHGRALYRLVQFRSSAQNTEDAPAMAAGIEGKLWDMADVVALIDAREGAPKMRGPYQKHGSCRNCGLLIGYHHLQDDKCSVKDCACQGYSAQEISH